MLIVAVVVSKRFIFLVATVISAHATNAFTQWQRHIWISIVDVIWLVNEYRLVGV